MPTIPIRRPAGEMCADRRDADAVPLLKSVIRMLAADTDLWTDALIVDSTPAECARSRQTVKRSESAGWGGCGYCSHHSRSAGP
jgi:hypothetical protein